MSKFFFKGRIDARQNHIVSGYNVNRDIKAGSKESPISIVVGNDERKAEVEQQLIEHDIVATILVDDQQAENTSELDVLLNKPHTVVLQKTPSRNDPCSCGSGHKYKKCCG